MKHICFSLSKSFCAYVTQTVEKLSTAVDIFKQCVISSIIKWSETLIYILLLIVNLRNTWNINIWNELCIMLSVTVVNTIFDDFYN